MGIYDREYYRGDESPGLGLSVSRHSVTVRLVAANVVVYLICIFTPQLYSLLILHGESIYQPWMWWQFVTYGFVHDLRAPSHIVFNMMALWFFGSEIEAVYGRKNFLYVFFAAVMLGAVVWMGRLFAMASAEPEAQLAVLTAHRLLGASGGVTAVVLLFCLKFPHRIVQLMFVLPVPAWLLGVLLVLGDVLGAHGDPGGVAYDVHLVGAAVGFLFFRFGKPSLSRSGRQVARRGRGFSSWFARLRPRPKLRVHSPDRSDEFLDSDIEYAELDRRGDEILQKWHREGEGSLSDEERILLEAYSRRMQQKHR